MALLSGIGRALTSIGSDMQRNRLERDERERFFADRKYQQDYAAEIRTQQAGIRAAETQANRDWSRRQQEAQNLYTAGVTKVNRDWTVTEFDRQARVRADAAEAAGERAGRVLAEGRAHDVTTQELGAEAYDRAIRDARRAGMPKGIPYLNPDELWKGPTGADVVAISDANISLPTRATPRAAVQPSEALMVRAEEDIYREQGSYDDAGMLVGDPASMRDVYNRASRIANQNLYPVPPPQTTSPEFDPYAPPRARPGPGPLDQPGQSPGPRRDAGSGRQQQPGQPMVSQEAFEMARRSGRYTQEELDDMLGGRFNPYGQAGR